ncbi:unnamed protein product [Penicillium roqueforti FM164]|uniref:Genomic scaffold, ProqFM164S03 n=1 Tax=Penicillium roqueforti (strain FM164) TaxID=1365484 RepID=W6QCR5_PENRF|nr:unnamed protein product [Penicillium roqueforti FM164]
MLRPNDPALMALLSTNTSTLIDPKTNESTEHSQHKPHTRSNFPSLNLGQDVNAELTQNVDASKYQTSRDID